MQQVKEIKYGTLSGFSLTFMFAIMLISMHIFNIIHTFRSMFAQQIVPIDLSSWIIV